MNLTSTHPNHRECDPDADQVAALAEPPRPLTTRISDWLESNAGHLPATACDTLRRLLADTLAEPLPTQLVHHDFRSANILCAGARVTGVIDFALNELIAAGTVEPVRQFTSGRMVA